MRKREKEHEKESVLGKYAKKPSKHKEARVGAWEEGSVNSTEE